MKNTLKKLLSVLAAVLVLITCASMLFACNPEKKEQERRERDRRARVESVTAVENAFLAGVNEEWSVDLENAELAQMDGVADYLSATYWAQFVGDVLVKSSLQTGKLQAFAGAVKSEEGKLLIESFSDNAELILPLLKTVDFTPTDISNLVYDLLCALARDSGSVFDSIIARVDEIRAVSEISAPIFKSLGEFRADMDMTKSAFVPTVAKRNEMLAAFDSAKAPMSALLEFAYNMSIGAVGNNVFDTLLAGGGALSDISNGEIITLVSALASNIESLKASLSGDAVDDLNSAFDKIIENFDTSAFSSVLIAQIVQYARTAYMIVDVIPTVCDLAYSAMQTLTQEDVVGELKGVVGKDLNNHAQFANITIIVSKMALQVMNSFGKSDFETLIADINEKSIGDYKKSAPLVTVDALLNVGTLLEGIITEDYDAFEIAHSDIIDDDTLWHIISYFTVSFGGGFEKYRQAYYAYMADIEDGSMDDGTYGKLLSASSIFSAFGIENRYLQSDVKSWAKWYLDNGEAKLNEAIDVLNGKVKDDLFEFINDYYAEGSTVKAELEKLANMSFVEEDLTEDEFKQYVSKAANARIIGILGLFSKE